MLTTSHRLSVLSVVLPIVLMFLLALHQRTFVNGQPYPNGNYNGHEREDWNRDRQDWYSDQRRTHPPADPRDREDWRSDSRRTSDPHWYPDSRDRDYNNWQSDPRRTTSEPSHYPDPRRPPQDWQVQQRRPVDQYPPESRPPPPDTRWQQRPQDNAPSWSPDSIRPNPVPLPPAPASSTVDPIPTSAPLPEWRPDSSTTEPGYYSYSTEPNTNSNPAVTEHAGGTITMGVVVFGRDRSPYMLRNDLIVEREAQVLVEPGVEIRFAPQIGITVRGILTAAGTSSDRIQFTSADEADGTDDRRPDIRLVDGPSILAGRVQINYNGKWRSVCTNSKNWTITDMETACRQLGFQGGAFYGWFNRQMPLQSRLLYEEPQCAGSERTLSECSRWPRRQMGSGICDYHPDLGIQCSARHARPLPNWRGLRFERARHDKRLTLFDTLYVPTSLSRLEYVTILRAGNGRGHNATSAVHVEGVPPMMLHMDVLDSAYNGVNVTAPEAPVLISDTRLRGNRGYGVFVNSSFGSAHIHRTSITENGADGVRYVQHEERSDEQFDKSEVSDFCTIATVSSQTFPLQVFAEQRIFSSVERRCSKVFATKYGHRITLKVLRAVTDRNNSADIEIYDGSSTNNRLLSAFAVRNNTRPQSVTTLTNQIFVKFRADAATNMYVYMRFTSGLDKAYDLNVSYSDISENGGNGVAFDNLRSQLHVHNSSISRNGHVAGVYVSSGVGDVNITSSRIAFNDGDGINVTYTGGNRNISRSSVSSNGGYGFALWLNQTKETEYLFVNQTSVVEYSEIVHNLDIGVLHGNYCGHSYINVTGNRFMNNVNDALEILSCWIQANSTKLQIGHNSFTGNERLGVKIYPALNIDGKIEHNWFQHGTFGQLLIKNKPLEEFNVLKTNLLVQSNYFLSNFGIFVVNLGLSPYSETQHLLFTKNFVKNNIIKEPFQPEDGSVSKLNPRSRVAAPIVIASSNVKIYRNIIENLNSSFEIGSHLEDQSKIINCTFNWLGSHNEDNIYHRIFHRYNRYNLAKVIFMPFLLHNSHPATMRINDQSRYVPRFLKDKIVGGEIEGEEYLEGGEYSVDKDINIRPGGKLTLAPGVTLRFPPSIGIMVGGKLEARGLGPDSIRFTLKEEIEFAVEQMTYDAETEKYEIETEAMQEVESKTPIRLLGGNSPTEGRLQIKINDTWGTVCNYGWTIKNAALVCQQLGLVLNPDDWNLERNEIPNAGTSESILLSNVQCDDYDLDVTKCRAEKLADFENSCDHDLDVGVRCYETSWAGVRFGVLAERSDLQYITVEKSGLLDYATSTFKPAIQMDFARQNFENIKITDNYHDGFGIMYSDIYTEDSVNIIKNSDFVNNRGAGISFKQLGLQIRGSRIENNFIGIQHNPALSGLQQRELAGWFATPDQEVGYKPFWIPHQLALTYMKIELGETKHVVTAAVVGDNIARSYRVQCNPGYVIGIQLLNPIENRSTETIFIHDSQTYNNNSAVWNVNRDLAVFPTTSSSHGIIIDYNSGSYSIGNTVIVLSAIKAPAQNVYNRIVKGPVPTLTLINSKIKRNNFGIHISYYNRYYNELGDHFLRKSNESIKLIGCELSHNLQEAIFVHSPHWDLHKSNISEITIMINNSLITDNARGIYHFARDMRSSNNLFHYIFQDNTIERNAAKGLDLNLPYVWQYNENFTHSLFIDNNTWRNNRDFEMSIDGHFAIVNITNSVFSENSCKNGLLAIKGMEKKLKIDGNRITNNNGKYMVEFSSDSQCEIMGEVPAKFFNNELRHNRFMSMLRGFGVLQVYSDPTSVVKFKGVQKVKINRNLISNNSLDYDLVAGIKTAKIDNYLDVRENWWGTGDANEIEMRIFDFDDWNNHAIAQFRPYLMQEQFDANLSPSYVPKKEVDPEYLRGRIEQDLVIWPRPEPYHVNADITVMPQVTLTIQPGVTMEFAPNVGILVLGNLQAHGFPNSQITLRSQTRRMSSRKESAREKRYVEAFVTTQDSIRLCKGIDCSGNDSEKPNEGFLEYFNQTTLQWIPMCDARFTERNAQVVCRELGFDSLNAFFAHDIRIEFHSNSLSRIWSWPEPLQCKGIEPRYDDCPIRLNGQQFGHRHECKWDSKFVFIHCGNEPQSSDYWGGVRFADPDFEQNLYENRIHDHLTHQTVNAAESRLEFVNVFGAGILHNERSPAIQSIKKSPALHYVNVTQSASHGINLISPPNTINIVANNVQDCLGVGINFLSITGEGRESDESSFTPLKNINIPYNLYSMVDICDATKELRVEERMLVYYKYDNHPVNCVKIFRSKYNVKPFGFRLLQFNLFNATNKYGIPDFISLHDGDLYNVSSRVIGRITTDSRDERRMFKTRESSLSVKLFANGASGNYGFIAEVVTLPISAIGFNRDVQHNITTTVVKNNHEGGLLYISAGEVNPIVTVERGQFTNNCRKLYGNFTTCRAAIDVDVQNTQTLYFRNNLVNNNEGGGIALRADSRGSATSLKGYIHNNLFVNNTHLPALFVEGRHSSPYQEVTIYRNYITQNRARYENNIVLKQVVSNFTLNYVKRNVGLQNLEVSGFDKVRLPIYQTTTHNSFYHNFAVHVDTRSTIVAGTAGQHYIDNIFFNPDNDYEMITVNRSLFNFNSTLEVWKTKIDAAANYWGLNNTLAVTGRIRDYTDDPRLLEVIYAPYQMNNDTLLAGGKCPPGWDLVVDTCYMYVGAPMTFHEARDFCQSDNASMPYVNAYSQNYALYEFLRGQQEWFKYNDKVWVQEIDRINQCTAYTFQTIEVADCQERNSFLCEIDPKVFIDGQIWRGDILIIALITAMALGLLLIGVVAACWWNKSKYRHAQRLERRNSIRQSRQSLRSIGGSTIGFSENGYRRKPGQVSTRSTDTLTKASDYRKMVSNGSLDSMEKSTYNSSIEDQQSYDIYEAHNPNAHLNQQQSYPVLPYHQKPISKFETATPYAQPTTAHSYNQLGFKNEGFKDNSTFASNSNYPSRSASVQETTLDDHSELEHSPVLVHESSYPPSDYHNTDTLPLHHNGHTAPSSSQGYHYASREIPKNYLSELKSKLPSGSRPQRLPSPPTPPRADFNTVALPLPPDLPRSSPPSTFSRVMHHHQRPMSAADVLETNFDDSLLVHPSTSQAPTPAKTPRARSEAALLETNFDCLDIDDDVGVPMTHHISAASRSKSQPLETAM